MYNVLKSVISARGYKLAEIQSKIKKLYSWGDLTDAQMDELLALAASGVSTDAERPEMLDMLRTLFTEIEALTARVAALEGSNNETADPNQPEYAEWTPWNGISEDYQNGAIVSHNGELWRSDFAGQNVWEPGAAGTENLWVKYIPAE